MMNDYYYLIASLPKLSFPEFPKFEFDSVYEIIVNNLSASDRELFNKLIYPNDNKNLIAAIARNQNKVSPFYQFEQPSVLNQETINNFQKLPGSFPDYMKSFIEDNREEIATKDISELEKHLLEIFYQEMLASKDSFIRDYYAFELDLKNIVTAINCRKYEFEIDHEILGEGLLQQQLKRNSASDFGLSIEYPFMDSLVEAMDSGEPNRLESQINGILWNHVDEMVRFSFFNTHKVFAYGVHLLIAKRWTQLDPEEGKKRREELIDKIMEKFELPQLQS